MRTFTKISIFFIAIFMAASLTNAQQQIAFEGNINQGQGFASWNADGSGPEPAATGHINPNTGTASTYYAASYDYITENPDHAGFHMMPGMTGFSTFEQALSNNGYSPEDVKVKLGLGSYEEDVEGLDWFSMEDHTFANHYSLGLSFEIDGEPMLSGHLTYINHQRTGSENYWYINSSFTNLTDISVGGALSELAAAFLNDLNGKELVIYGEMVAAQIINGYGRSGYAFNLVNGMLTVGNPTLPFEGLNADHEGFAGWDADGSGPEPEANGHNTQLYYGASLDYDGIDPDPNACLGHFLDGSTGFFNTLLQLQYRGFEIGDLKVKLGLESLGPDVQGEDWGTGWSNYYNNSLIVEIGGEPILAVMQDTNKLVSMSTYWLSGTSFGQVYDISTNASPEAQSVAQSFLNDMGTHFLRTNVDEINYVMLFDGSGRDGAIYEITAGAFVAIHAKATFIPEGPVSGTWTAENSPYYVDGHLTVENGETLTIEPGVEVAVRGPYRFDVQGCLKAEGTADDNIIFTRSNPNLWWDGFDFFETPADNQASVFDHCLFEYGYGLGAGQGRNSGGMFAIKQFDSVMILNSIFRYNKVNRNGVYPPSGGAIGLWNANIFVSKCIFYENEAEYGGAFFAYENSEPVVSNCLFYNNHAYYGGAITMYEYCNGVFINNTIATNTANYGGAFYFYYLSNPEIINSIIWDNEATIGDQVYSSTSAVSHPGFYYCDIEGGQAGFGGSQINGGYFANLEDDPMFSGDEFFPYSLLNENSPCWNAGTPDTSALFIAYNQYLPETCLCDSTRIADGCIEIGAYEYPLSVGINQYNLLF